MLQNEFNHGTSHNGGPNGAGNENEKLLSPSKSVHRRDNVVFRPVYRWTPSVHALLRHLEKIGFEAAPRIVDSGFDSNNREMLGYVEGDFVHPGPWRDEALMEVGRLLRRLHRATADYRPSGEAEWQPWFLRELGGENGYVMSHGDVAPWNTVTRDGMPVALIDWEYAGPIDPMVELARVCWLFPQLHDDDVASMAGLPPLEVRARQVRLLADGYGASADQRRGLLDRIIAVVVHETAEEAIERHVVPDSHGPLWGFAWKARSAAWILRNRAVLEQALL